MKVGPQEKAASLEGGWLTNNVSKVFKDAVCSGVKFQSGHFRITPGT